MWSLQGESMQVSNNDKGATISKVDGFSTKQVEFLLQ